MRKINFKLALEVLAIVAISAVYLFLFSSHVPFHMDEVGYHALICNHYPLGKLNTFREAYGMYDLAPALNLYLPLRSYSYRGSFPSILYYPLFRLWPSPYSARLLGLIMLAIQAFCLHKLFKIDLLVSFILLLSFMAYAFQHIVDFGNLTSQTTSVFLVWYLTREWMDSFQNNSKRGWIYPLTIGIILFLGIWTKLAFFAVLPGLFILIVYHIVRKKSIWAAHSSKFKRLIRHLLILFSAAGIPAYILFNSTTRLQTKYFDFLFEKAHGLSSIAPNLKLGNFLLNPLLTAHRIFVIDDGRGIVAGIFSIVIIAILLLFGLRQLYVRKMNYGFVILNILLFFMVFYSLSSHPRSWAMHHVVLSYPFLILAIFHIYSKLNTSKLISALLVLFLVVNLSLYYDLSRLPHREEAHPSLLKINKLLNEQYTDQYVFIVIDWGMYYLKALYGNKNQCVLYIEPLNREEHIVGVKKVLNRLKRKALFIGRSDSESDLSLIKRSFPDLVQLETAFDTGVWRVWHDR